MPVFDTSQLIAIGIVAVPVTVAIFMFFLLGIVEDICNYKLARWEKQHKDTDAR